MAIGIIDFFEIVDIEHRIGYDAVVSLRFIEKLLDKYLENIPVVELGEFIDRRKIYQRFERGFVDDFKGVALWSDILKIIECSDADPYPARERFFQRFHVYDKPVPQEIGFLLGDVAMGQDKDESGIGGLCTLDKAVKKRMITRHTACFINRELLFFLGRKNFINHVPIHDPAPRLLKLYVLRVLDYSQKTESVKAFGNFLRYLL